ncbi:MAG: lipopolysaccharide biosynthesis protein [Reyranella sp.]|jgi:PST family polysaccharide transporter|uniref:lipopolysaccharide biosynthesis protein n=1 Tax=Reyranella sp. TaxID=1929291 RepID=UPI0025F1DA37|nr:lipopolysaccharide biosynthesis protein [Reyranella sp.]MBR2817121.1 lipopolysaccharide biosynthesis protein [Reyranella sp.]
MSRPKNGAPSPDAELATGHLDADLGRRSRRGGVLLMGAQAVRVLGQLVTLVILARILPPAAFGLLAMVASLNLVLDLLKELGLSSATIQRNDLTQAQVSALFWINAGAGFLLAALLALVAPLLADFYDQPDLTAVARWLALGFAMSGLTVQHWALLRRQMRFGAIAGLETVADYAGYAAAIGLAVAGEGYWALVAQRLITPAVLMVGSWLVCRWRPARPAAAPGLRELLNFGASVTVSGFATALSRSFDQIMIGWLWGAATLGLYERTARLLMLPVNAINAPVYSAGMPALSRLVEQPDRYRVMFRQMVQKLGLLTMPVFAVAALTADWMVEILLGRSWEAAVPLVSLFSATAIFLPVMLSMGLLFLSQGRTREFLRANLLDAGLCLAAIVAGLSWGSVGVAAGLAIATVAVRTPLAFWLATRRGPVHLGDVCRAAAPPASAAVAAAAAVLSVRALVPHNFTLESVTAVGAAASVSILIVLLLWPETRRELRSGARHVAVYLRRRRAVLEP